jgi:hypothetical protein
VELPKAFSSLPDAESAARYAGRVLASSGSQSICYRAAMLTSWHAFWHTIEPYYFALLSVFFLVFVVHGLFTGVTYLRGAKVYRAESPISYWFTIVFALLWGVFGTVIAVAAFLPSP